MEKTIVKTVINLKDELVETKMFEKKEVFKRKEILARFYKAIVFPPSRINDYNDK